MKQLMVILLGQEVGILEQNSVGKITFRYRTEWLEQKVNRPLSQSLPLRKEKFNEKECAPFFGGLLPEEQNREIIARNLGISPRNDYAMLREIGGECAGAVSLIPIDATSAPKSSAYQEISEAELIEILDQLPQRPLLAGRAEIRLSLAGAQNKVALYINKTGYALPLQESPSSHILKPEMDRFPGLADNEAYCLKLAAAVGLNVCQAEIRQLGPHRCILVTRYDRLVRNNSMQRLHQEDFCQALAIPSRNKYQMEGGPSLSQCFDLVRKASTRPAQDLLQLFNGVLYNYLIGNHDAHGKNFSLLYGSSEEPLSLRLAPFYDLICTAIYPQLTSKMAMKIGKSSLPEEITSRDWERYWESIGFSRKQARKQTLQFIDGLSLQCGAPENEVQAQIQDVITKRSEWLHGLFC